MQLIHLIEKGKSKTNIVLIAMVMFFTQASAQPFILQSKGANKPFKLKIYYGTFGNGAFVQYQGQQGIIPLKISSRVVHRKGQRNAAATITYVWNELVNGIITGSYGLTQNGTSVSSAWYRRKKDGQRFLLEDTGQPSEIDRYLLHGILISFYHTANDQLTFKSANGSTRNIELPSFDHPDPLRKANIADYNFDGFDDLAFSIPDAGMGVYRTFNIFLYDPNSKLFIELTAPNEAKANCSGLCDVTLDQKNKLLLTACRGAATWWQDVYRFSKTNELVWLRSSKKQ